MSESIKSTNITWHQSGVSPEDRAQLMGHQPALLWFTGLSGSGKSTLANGVARALHDRGVHTYVLDGDNVRHGLNRDLGFTAADRVENIRRVGEAAKLMVDAGLITIVSFISPFRSERRMVRDLLDEGEFVEVFVDTPLEVCEQRDPKGLYKRARAGEITNFTGIDSEYQPPEAAELHIRTTETSPEQAVEQVLGYLEARGVLG